MPAKIRKSWKRFVGAVSCRDRIFMRDKLKNEEVYGEVKHVGGSLVYIVPGGEREAVRFFNWQSTKGRYGIYRTELPHRVAVRVNRETD